LPKQNRMVIYIGNLSLETTQHDIAERLEPYGLVTSINIVMNVATKMVVTTRPEAPIYDAIRVLANRNIADLPVVDADLNLVGILSDRDVLALLYETRDRADQTVADYMCTDVFSLDVGANLIDLCDCLVDSNFRSVPITEDGKRRAIASRGGVIQRILRVKNQAF
jgi:CBS domain-containing protein